jgi:hypothetical protein
VPGTDRAVTHLTHRILQKRRLTSHDHTSQAGLTAFAPSS